MFTARSFTRGARSRYQLQAVHKAFIREGVHRSDGGLCTGTAHKGQCSTN